jgi:hypothetical protein
MIQLIIDSLIVGIKKMTFDINNEEENPERPVSFYSNFPLIFFRSAMDLRQNIPHFQRRNILVGKLIRFLAQQSITWAL